MAWYKEWFGSEYLELYAHRDAGEADRHVDFVERVIDAGKKPRAVLDLACGAGRHTAALRRRGYHTLGTDLSLTLLATPPRVPSVAADMAQGTRPMPSICCGWSMLAEPSTSRLTA